MERHQLFIDGKLVAAETGKTFHTHNPATGEPIAEVAEASDADVDRAVRAAHRALEQGPWPQMVASERAAVMFKVAQLLRERADALAKLETTNSGKTITDAKDDVLGAAACFEYYAGAATKIFGETIPVSGRGLDFTLREPMGVAALIVPWNFPLAIASWKLAPALAVGCTAVLKPASYTPLTALALGGLCAEAGAPAGVVNVVTGPGARIGMALVRHPLVAKVAFTGETTTGQEIMREAAGTMKRVSLELGGKSPLIVFADADLERAVSVTPYSVFGNAGQDCCARSRAFVERKVYERFVEGFAKRAQALRVGDPLDATTEIGPLVSRKRFEVVSDYIRIGKAEGAKLACGGDQPKDPTLARGTYLTPAVFADVHNRMRIAQEEIFGPVASLIPFSDEEELIAMVNDSPYGLSGSIWTRDVGRALRVAKRVKSGVLGVNTNRSVFIEAPFGGYKMSGMGRDLGMHAMHNYTEVKNVFVSLD